MPDNIKGFGSGLGLPSGVMLGKKSNILPPLGTKIIGKTIEGRPVVLNPDNSISTERTVTMEVDGRFFSIPTLFGGKAVDPETALGIILKNKFVDPETGKVIEGFSSEAEAIAAAELRSRSIKFDEQTMKILKQLGINQ